MNASTLILAILSLGDTSGYDIRKMSQEGPFSYFIDIGYGAIYPTLARLEAAGFVNARVERSQGKPDRKVYALTPEGKIEFVDALCQPPQPDKMKSEFLLLAAMAPYCRRDVIEKAIDVRIEHLEAEHERVCQSLVDGQCAENEGLAWVGEYGLAMFSADVKYLTGAREKLLAIAGQNLANDKNKIDSKVAAAE